MVRPLFACALLIPALGCLPGADAAGIATEIRRELAARGAVRVVAALVRGGATETGRSRLEKSPAFGASEERLLPRLPAACLVRHRYRFTPALALEITSEEALDALAALPEIATISLDVEGRGALLESRALTRVNEVFDLGVTGRGRVVAILDTGVDTDHPDLAGSIVHAYHFFGADDSGPGAEDDHGHGTHVAGIIASRGLQSPRGIAPGCEIVAIKVLSENNRGFLTDWAAGVEHVIGLHDDGLRIDVINMSLVSDALYPGACNGTVPVFRNACQAAKGRGILLVASTGDTGSTESIRSPACYTSVVAVGSSSATPSEAVSSFTDRSDIVDLLAPGEDITSTAIGGEATFSGTSQASAHVSGVAALIREIAPDLDPDGILSVLASTGVPVVDAATGLSFPRVDALGALEELVGEADCDGSGKPDRLELVLGTVTDLNQNGVPDGCEGPLYLRGDANADGRVNLSDPIHILGSLFGGAAAGLSCERSADANADELVNIADSVYVLNFLFAAGAAPPLPHPDCGLAPGDQGPLGCVSHAACAS